MKHKTIQTLYLYWNELRAGRIAPRRLEIEPSRISPVLAETFMLERSAPATYSYRLAGTRLCEIFGRELRETNLLGGWDAADQAILQRSLAITCEQGAVSLVTMEGRADRVHFVQIEAIFLPLVHTDNTISRVIGAMGVMTSPPWLGYEPLTETHLVRHEHIWPDGRPHSVIQRAGDQAPFMIAAPRGRLVSDARRRFRVFDGGRGER